MLWRPSCPPFCKHVTDMSEINFNMLNRFLDLKNLCVATKSMCLAHILKKILRILSFGDHLGRHLEYFNFPNHSVLMYGHIGKHIYAKTFCADYFFGLHPKSSFGNLTIIALLHCMYSILEHYGDKLTFSKLLHLQIYERVCENNARNCIKKLQVHVKISIAHARTKFSS